MRPLLLLCLLLGLPMAARAEDQWTGKSILVKASAKVVDGARNAEVLEPFGALVSKVDGDWLILETTSVAKTQIRMPGQTDNDESPDDRSTLLLYKLRVRSADALLSRDAADYMADFVQQHPASALAWCELGAIRRLRKEFDKAIVAATEAIRINPKSCDAYTVRASAWKSLGDNEKSIRDWDAALALTENKANRGRRRMIYFGRARAQLELKNFDRAIEDFTKVLQLNERDALSYQLRAEAWLGLRNIDKAIEDLDQGIKFETGSRDDSLYLRASLFILKQNFEAAINDLTAVLLGNPDERTALITRHLRFSIELQQKQYDAALRDLNAIIKMAPQAANGYVARGGVHARLGNFSEAVDDFTKAISLGEKGADVYVSRGEAWRADALARSARGDEQGASDCAVNAIQDASKAIVRGLNTAGPLVLRASAWEIKGAFDLAIADYTAALAIKPVDNETQILRAKAYSQRGQFAKAIEDATDILARDKVNCAALDIRGHARFELGEFERALADFREITRLDPERGEGLSGSSLVQATASRSEIRDGATALTNSRRACELTHWKIGAALEAYAAACAETGDFKAAVEWQQKILEHPSKNKRLQRRHVAELEQYQSNKPFRFVPNPAGEEPTAKPAPWANFPDDIESAPALSDDESAADRPAPPTLPRAVPEPEPVFSPLKP